MFKLIMNNQMNQRPMTIMSEQDLRQRILSKALVRGGVGKPHNQKKVITGIGNNVINFPGNTISNDIAFFAQPNPFGDLATVRFKQQLFEDKQNAFPDPTYYSNILVNDANTPIIFEPQQFIIANAANNRVAELERQKLQMVPRLSSTMLFPEQTQNTNPFL